MHSDLSTWNDFGEELALEGFDTWIIEPYGGPTTECDTCPVYTIANLTEYYWPALITGVQNYSAQNTLSYVGFDLGCTVALESLEMYESGKANAGYIFNSETGAYELDDLSADPIDTFVGLGCIGNFSYPSYQTGEDVLPLFADFIQTQSERGRYDEDNYRYYGMLDGHMPGWFYKGSIHTAIIIGDILTARTVSKVAKWAYVFISSTVSNIITGVDIIISSHNTFFPRLSSEPLSMGVYQDLATWMDSSVIIGDDINITNIAIIQSTYEENEDKLFGDVYLKGTDKFVSDTDQKEICQNINSNNKYYIDFDNIPHFGAGIIKGLSEKPEVESLIKDYLADTNIDGEDTYQIISDNTNCE